MYGLPSIRLSPAKEGTWLCTQHPSSLDPLPYIPISKNSSNKLKMLTSLS